MGASGRWTNGNGSPSIWWSIARRLAESAIGFGFIILILMVVLLYPGVEFTSPEAQAIASIITGVLAWAISNVVLVAFGPIFIFQYKIFSVVVLGGENRVDMIAGPLLFVIATSVLVIGLILSISAFEVAAVEGTERLITFASPSIDKTALAASRQQQLISGSIGFLTALASSTRETVGKMVASS